MRNRRLFLILFVFTTAGCVMQNRKEIRDTLDITEKIVEGNLSEPVMPLRNWNP